MALICDPKPSEIDVNLDSFLKSYDSDAAAAAAGRAAVRQFIRKTTATPCGAVQVDIQGGDHSYACIRTASAKDIADLVGTYSYDNNAGKERWGWWATGKIKTRCVPAELV